MDGYSVEEAAEVLGIPQGRVWELIARGVLAGASEGRTDMRVFLRPPAGTGSPPPPGAEDGGSRANGGTHVEASPFRELLTELRNLTERYGQALLALGEARGEVAALRSRVEVLEARMDMRLPLRAASTVAWELPDRYASERAAGQVAAPTEQPAEEATEDAEPMLEPPQPEPIAEDAPSAAPEVVLAEPDTQAEERHPEVTVVIHAEPAAAEETAVQEPEPPKRRLSSGRAAIAGLAEALARAEDPTLADLPGAREAGEALAALQRDVAVTADDHGEGADEPEAAPAEPAPGIPPEPVTAEEPEPLAEDIQAAFATPIELPEEPAPQMPEAQAPEADLPAAELPAPEAVAEPPEPAEPESEPATAELEPRPVEPASPYTTEVVEPDWFADGDFTWLDVPTPEPAAAETEPEPQLEPEAQPEAEPEPGPQEHEAEHIEAGDESPSVEAIQDAFSEPPAEPPNPWPSQDRGGITGGDAVGFNLFREPRGQGLSGEAAPPAAAEEELLWFGDEFEAADLEMETPGWRAGDRVPAESAGATVPAHVERPETITPDEAIERLAGDEGWDEAEVDAIRAYLGQTDVVADEAERPSPPTPPTAPEPPAPEVDASERTTSGLIDQDWLRGRRGPAATAYRRLRRLFQG